MNKPATFLAIIVTTLFIICTMLTVAIVSYKQGEMYFVLFTVGLYALTFSLFCWMLVKSVQS